MCIQFVYSWYNGSERHRKFWTKIYSDKRSDERPEMVTHGHKRRRKETGRDVHYQWNKERLVESFELQSDEGGGGGWRWQSEISVSRTSSPVSWSLLLTKCTFSATASSQSSKTWRSDLCHGEKMMIFIEEWIIFWEGKPNGAVIKTVTKRDEEQEGWICWRWFEGWMESMDSRNTWMTKWPKNPTELRTEIQEDDDEWKFQLTGSHFDDTSLFIEWIVFQIHGTEENQWYSDGVKNGSIGMNPQ